MHDNFDNNDNNNKGIYKQVDNERKKKNVTTLLCKVDNRKNKRYFSTLL